MTRTSSTPINCILTFVFLILLFVHVLLLIKYHVRAFNNWDVVDVNAAHVGSLMWAWVRNDSSWVIDHSLLSSWHDDAKVVKKSDNVVRVTNPTLDGFSWNLQLQNKSVDRFRRQPPPNPRPPLTALLQGRNITGNVSWLLNVAIVGMPKCGTSTMMHQLRNHPQIQMFGHERCELSTNDVGRLVRDLYRKFPSGTNINDGTNYVRGIKCPADLDSSKRTLQNYRTYFPNTDLIVGLRHPILWFESLYNFRVHNEYDMKPINMLGGSCIEGTHGVCTLRGNFHYALANLGIVHDPAAARYFPMWLQKQYHPPPPPPVATLSSRVFLYEVSQLSDPDPTRSQQFLLDLEHFLHVQQPFPPMILWIRPGKNHSMEKLRLIQARKVDICQPKYRQLRDILLQQSINASKWIREYFLDAPNVIVSNKDYLVHHIFPTWEQDPCLRR